MLLHLTLGVPPRDPAALVAPSAKRPATARAAATELAAVASPSPPPAPNAPPNVTVVLTNATAANATVAAAPTQGEQAEAMSGPTVRFYLYEPQSLSSFAACERDPGMRPGEVNKHAVARLLIERLQRSAWRTSSMDDAQLFVVPALLDWVARGRCNGTEAEHIANLTATVAPHLHRGRHAIWATDSPRRVRELREQLRKKLPGIAFGTYLGVLANETCVFNSGYSTYYDYVKAVRQGGLGWEAKLPELDAPKPFLVEFAGQLFNPLSGNDHVTGEPRWRENFRHRWNLFHTSGLDRNRSFITTYVPRKLDEHNIKGRRAMKRITTNRTRNFAREIARAVAWYLAKRLPRLARSRCLPAPASALPVPRPAARARPALPGTARAHTTCSGGAIASCSTSKHSMLQQLAVHAQPAC